MKTKFKNPVKKMLGTKADLSNLEKARQVRTQNLAAKAVSQPVETTPAPIEEARLSSLEERLVLVTKELEEVGFALESAQEKRAHLAATLLGCRKSDSRIPAFKKDVATLDGQIEELVVKTERLPQVIDELQRRLAARKEAEAAAIRNDAKKEMTKKLVSIQAVSKNILRVMTDAAIQQLHLTRLFDEYTALQKTSGIELTLESVTVGSQLIGIIKDVIYAEVIEGKNKRPQQQMYRI